MAESKIEHYSVPTKKMHDVSMLYLLYRSEWFVRVGGFIVDVDNIIQGHPNSEAKDFNEPVAQSLLSFFSDLSGWIDEIPLATQANRFGNTAYRVWFSKMANATLPMLHGLTKRSKTKRNNIVVGDAKENESENPAGEDVGSSILSLAQASLISQGGSSSATPPGSTTTSSPVSLEQELAGYLVESFGNYVRIDYGSGHELAFVSFLAALRQAGLVGYHSSSCNGRCLMAPPDPTCSSSSPSPSSNVEGSDHLDSSSLFLMSTAGHPTSLHSTKVTTSIISSTTSTSDVTTNSSPAQTSSSSPPVSTSSSPVLPPSSSTVCPAKHSLLALGTTVFSAYLCLMRKLQQRYWLEPAGSKGAWGLDDYQFLPFMWGSSQLIGYPEAPSPKLLFADATSRERLSGESLMADAVAYVATVKSGSFEVHSPYLSAISGLPSWQRASQGLHRMYGGEVLSKYPIIQHVLFGSLLPLTRSSTALRISLPPSTSTPATPVRPGPLCTATTALDPPRPPTLLSPSTFSTSPSLPSSPSSFAALSSTSQYLTHVSTYTCDELVGFFSIPPAARTPPPLPLTSQHQRPGPSPTLLLPSSAMSASSPRASTGVISSHMTQPLQLHSTSHAQLPSRHAPVLMGLDAGAVVGEYPHSGGLSLASASGVSGSGGMAIPSSHQHLISHTVQSTHSSNPASSSSSQTGLNHPTLAPGAPSVATSAPRSGGMSAAEVIAAAQAARAQARAEAMAAQQKATTAIMEFERDEEECETGGPRGEEGQGKHHISKAG